MATQLPLETGQIMPVEVYGKDQNGRFLDLRDIQGSERNALIYFYPLDGRTEPPRVLQDLARRLPEFEGLDTTVVGIRGPPETTKGANLDAVPFPLIEDRNYEMGQAVGLLRGITRRQTPRGFVLLDPRGHVLGGWREEGDPRILDEALARLKARG